MSELMDFQIPEVNSDAIIKVIGVGGGGGNAVNHMYHEGIQDVEFMICNTDAQALKNSDIPNRIQLGVSLTEGRGAGNKPEIGKEAAKESYDKIKEILSNNTKMVFVTAGMGGGTGTGAAPVIAAIARELEILTIGIVTIPFRTEGRKRLNQAVEGINELKEHVDSLLVINNERIKDLFVDFPVSEAFKRADGILSTAAKGIAEIITITGFINVDFADVVTVMKDSGVAIMGSATAAGENRAEEAIKEALNSPLLNDNNIQGAQNILVNIYSGDPEATMSELSTITEYVQDSAGYDADLIWGNGTDPALGDNIRVTVIATGFDESCIPTAEPPRKRPTNRPTGGNPSVPPIIKPTPPKEGSGNSSNNSQQSATPVQNETEANNEWNQQQPIHNDAMNQTGMEQKMETPQQYGQNTWNQRQPIHNEATNQTGMEQKTETPQQYGQNTWNQQQPIHNDAMNQTGMEQKTETPQQYGQNTWNQQQPIHNEATSQTGMGQQTEAPQQYGQNTWNQQQPIHNEATNQTGMEQKTETPQQYGQNTWNQQQPIHNEATNQTGMGQLTEAPQQYRQNTWNQQQPIHNEATNQTGMGQQTEAPQQYGQNTWNQQQPVNNEAINQVEMGHQSEVSQQYSQGTWQQENVSPPQPQTATETNETESGQQTSAEEDEEQQRFANEVPFEILGDASSISQPERSHSDTAQQEQIQQVQTYDQPVRPTSWTSEADQTMQQPAAQTQVTTSPGQPTVQSTPTNNDRFKPREASPLADRFQEAIYESHPSWKPDGTETGNTAQPNLNTQQEVSTGYGQPQPFRQETVHTMPQNSGQTETVTIDIPEPPKPPTQAVEESPRQEMEEVNYGSPKLMRRDFHSASEEELDEVESIPAYLRRKLKKGLASRLGGASGQPQASNRPQINQNNSFLHDNVD